MSLFRTLLLLVLSCAVMSTQSAFGGNWNKSKKKAAQPVTPVLIKSSGVKSVSNFKEYSLSASTDIVRAGRTSQRFEIRHDDCGQDDSYSDCFNDRRRIERQIDSNTWHDSIVWYGFSIFLPKDFPDLAPTNTTLSQVKLNSYREPLWDFNARKNWFTFEANASGQRCYAEVLSSMRGKWTDFALGIDYSISGDEGDGAFDGKFFDLWVNGQQRICNDALRPVLTKKMISKSKRSKVKTHFDWGIYNSYVSRWLDRNKTKQVKNEKFIDKHAQSGMVVESASKRPFEIDWGVELPTQVVYYDEIRYGSSRDLIDITLLEKAGDYQPVD